MSEHLFFVELYQYQYIKLSTDTDTKNLPFADTDSYIKLQILSIPILLLLFYKIKNLSEWIKTRSTY